MAYTKPSGVNSLWAASGDKTTIPPAKVSAGWVAEKPSFQYFNQILYNLGLYDAYNNERGIPEWDDETEYQATKSYVVGSDGNVYKCLVTDDDVDPTTDDGTNWLQVWNNQGVVKWNVSTTYTESAVVRYTDGESYVCHTPQPAGTLPIDSSAFINLKYFGAYAYAVSQLANGADSAVGFIYAGNPIAAFSYLIHEDGRIYSRNGATGTFSDPLDFNPTTGVDSGISGALLKQSAVIANTGSLSIDGSNNAITMTNAFANIEVGDVIRLTNAGVDDGEYTVEFSSISAVRVNEAHAGKGTTKSLTSGAYGGATVSLVTKWHSAGIGIGQEWLDVSSDRLGSDTPFRNLTGKSIGVSIVLDASLSSDGAVQTSMDNVTWTNVAGQSGTVDFLTASFTLPRNAYVRLRAPTFKSWSELR